VHGDVSESPGLVGRAARFSGGAGPVAASLAVNGGGGLLVLPNLMRRCSSYSCADVRERVEAWSVSMWVKVATAAPRRQVLLALGGAKSVGTAAGSAGVSGLAMYTVAEAEFAMELEAGRLVVWIKGVRYDAARAARGTTFEDQGPGTGASAGASVRPSASSPWRGGAESGWREPVSAGKWTLLAVSMEASADYGPAGGRHKAAAAGAAPGNPLPPPAGAVASSDGRGTGILEAGHAVGSGAAGVVGGPGRGGLTMTMYVDGRPVLDFAPVAELNQDAGPLLVGGCNCTKATPHGAAPRGAGADAAHEPFNGWLDSFRVWTRALQAEEVMALARSAPADAVAPSPHLELPFPVQAIDVPSAPQGIQVRRALLWCVVCGVVRLERCVL